MEQHTILSNSVAKPAPGRRAHQSPDTSGQSEVGPLRLLLDLARQGDVARYEMGTGTVLLVNHPTHIERFLRSANYKKITLLSMVLGDGLLTSEGDFWRRQRRLMQPGFHRKRIVELATVMTTETAAMLTSWRSFEERMQPLDVTAEMMRLTLSIVAKSLFNADLRSDELGAVSESLSVLIEDLGHLVTQFSASTIISPARNRRVKAEIEALDRVVEGIIHKRTGDGAGPDLLSMLLMARDDNGEGMTRQELRDEIITLLLAGHETTGNVLAWTWYLLSENPGVERALHLELDKVLDGREPTVRDLPNLQYTHMVLQEAMRLYPPVWTIARKAVAEDEIGGCNVPANSTVIVSPYTMHRHPDFWQNAERFDPERFTPQRSEGRPRYAYFPFGGGRRICIGNEFAAMETQLVLAIVAQRYRLRLVPGHPVEALPLLTLRQRNGVLMTLEPR